MTARTIKAAMAAAFFSAIAALAAVGPVQAGQSPFNECRKWADTGEDMRCFDCYQLHMTSVGERWVNTCSSHERGGSDW